MKIIYADIFPETLEDETLCVSNQYRTSAHMCASGCGLRVVLPLGKGGWDLTDRDSVTLSPSVHVPSCNSHYWLELGTIRWSTAMSLKRAKEYSRLDQERHTSEINGRHWFYILLSRLLKIFRR